MHYNIMLNSLVQWNKDEKLIERVLWISEEIDIVFLINIFDRSWPYEIKLSKLYTLLIEEEIDVITNEIHFRVVDEVDISDKDVERRNKSYQVVMEFYKNIDEPNIFMTRERNKFINNVISKYGISRSTVEDYVKKFWKRGKTINSLLTDYHHCGNAKKDKGSGVLKRGRPKVNEINTGINIDEKMKKIFKTSINKFYNNQKKNSLVTAYNLMLKQYFSEEIISEKGRTEIILKDKQNIPSLAQFRYWFNISRDLKKEITTRNGGRIFYQKYRAVLNSVNDSIIGSGMEYQIDATIGDVYLVSEFNKKWIIGRPTIYIIVDTYSRLITGFNITLESASWVGAMVALANAMTDKVKFCKEEYGIEISEEEWPSKHVPFSILGDRGTEVMGFNSDNLVNNLGIKLSNTPPFRPEWKPIVEQTFNLLNIDTNGIPGSISPDFRERGAKCYSLDAKLNIKQFTKIIIRCILYHNNHHILKGYKREKGMIADEVESIPVKLWNWGVENKSGILRTVQEDVIKLSLMPRDKAIVTKNGIRFKGIFYSSLTAIKDRIFETARSKGNFPIDIVYDPRSLNNIYWINKDSTKYEKCFLLNKEYRYLDKAIEEVEYLRQKELLMLKDVDKVEVEKKINLINDIEAIVKEATMQSSGIELKPSDMKGIRENRQAEKFINRKKETFILGNKEEKRGVVINYKVEDESEDDLMMLKVRQKGGKYNEE
ncbi:MAG TPA: Mu transposase C-terminal domain-containing protein [Clostridium sp.]|uniref:Mu transposase C-terminal domain-containing protein n=1 Tax=Clostridium sp. TaxID=1506 RepID=UPI002F9525E7